MPARRRSRCLLPRGQPGALALRCAACTVCGRAARCAPGREGCGQTRRRRPPPAGPACRSWAILPHTAAAGRDGTGAGFCCRTRQTWAWRAAQGMQAGDASRASRPNTWQRCRRRVPGTTPHRSLAAATGRGGARCGSLRQVVQGRGQGVAAGRGARRLGSCRRRPRPTGGGCKARPPPACRARSRHHLTWDEGLSGQCRDRAEGQQEERAPRSRHPPPAVAAPHGCGHAAAFSRVNRSWVDCGAAVSA